MINALFLARDNGLGAEGEARIGAMRASGGSVVVDLAAERSLVAGPGCVKYDTAKAAILALTRSMARECAA